MQWEGKFGPASLLAVAQLLALVVGMVYGYAKLENTAANTAETTSVLRDIIGKQRARTDAISDRMIKVETTLTNVATTVDRLDTKLDKITTNTAKP